MTNQTVTETTFEMHSAQFNQDCDNEVSDQHGIEVSFQNAQWEDMADYFG